MARYPGVYLLSMPFWATLALGACGRDSEAPRNSGDGSSGTVSPPALSARPRPAPGRRPPEGLRPAPPRPDATLVRALFRGGSGRRGRFPGPGPRARRLEVRYGARLAREVHASAVSDGRTVFLVSTRGLVVAARVSDGGILWSRSTRAGVMAAPGVGGGHLFVGDRTGWVWCLGARTGAVRWKRKVIGAVRTALLPQAGRVVVGTHGGRLVSLDAATGTVRWEIKQRRPFVGLAGSPDGRVIAAASFDRRVRLLEASTGRVIWTAALKSSSRVAPVLTARAVYILSASGDLSRHERQTGRQVWSQHDLGFKSFPPVVTGGRIYVASRKRLLYALDERTGRSRWVKPLSDIPSAAPVFARDSIFLATRGPRLLAIRADTGGHYVNHSLPSLVLAEPLPLGNGLLLVDQRGIATFYVGK